VLRQNFECIRNCWDAKIGNWCAMDFESWEIDHRLVTEVGYSRVWWENGEEKSEVKHIIIKENSHLINHQYVAGNRDVSQWTKFTAFSSLIEILVWSKRKSSTWTGERIRQGNAWQVAGRGAIVPCFPWPSRRYAVRNSVFLSNSLILCLLHAGYFRNGTFQSITRATTSRPSFPLMDCILSTPQKCLERFKAISRRVELSRS
jgi:hypothetical protein